MCIISSKELPIISFSSMENLILWESWIDQTCCRGIVSFFWQFNWLKNAPNLFHLYYYIKARYFIYNCLRRLKKVVPTYHCIVKFVCICMLVDGFLDFLKFLTKGDFRNF